MKKYKLLVAPLLVLPFVIGCNNGGGDKPEEVKFSLSGNPTLDGKVATVNVDWTPTDSIKFESFTFTATPSKENTATFDQTGDPRPMPVTITFKDDVTEDISGTLKFSYEDVTAKTKGESSLTFTIPKPSVDPYQVSEDEFNDALAFKNDTYIQEIQDLGGGIIYTYEVAPDKSHVKYDNEAATFMPSYSEYFIKKENGTLIGAYRDDKEGDFEETQAMLEENFFTPEKLSTNLKNLLGTKTFNDFEYKNNVYTTVVSGTTFTLKFENKKLISFIGESSLMGTMNATFTYNETFPDWPKVIDPHEVNATEFADALALKNSEYIQVTKSYDSLTSLFEAEVAPDESHFIMSDTENPANYYESYVKVENGVYSGLYRESEDDDYTAYEDSEAAQEDFFDPESLQTELMVTFTLPTFDECTYANEVYTGEGQVYSYTAQFVFSFYSKKLDLLKAEVQDQDTITEDFSYYETPIVWPDIPDYTVTEDEFNAALAFTNEEYLQVENSDDSVPGLTSFNLDECSPNIYHYLLEIHMTGVMDTYDEHYVYKINENTYKKITRNSEATPWESVSWVDASEEFDWNSPQKYGSTLAYRIGDVEFDSSKYDSNTHSYTLKNSSEAEFVFKFENKKLIYLDFAGEQESTFTYNQGTPVLPIDPPTE